jgi:hypothetical protein
MLETYTGINFFTIFGTILTEIEDDAPGRRCRAEDLEGHRWFFMERYRG